MKKNLLKSFRVFCTGILVTVMCLILYGCVQKNIQLDMNYGIRYTLENENQRGYLTLYMDSEQKDVVAAISITVHPYSGFLNEELVEALMKENSTNYRNLENEETVYSYLLDKTIISSSLPTHSSENVVYPKEGGYEERIQINLSKKNLNLKEHSLLVKHLGLEEELEDGVLYYKEELLKSDTFIYKWIIDNGILQNNISFSGVSKYDYLDYDSKKNSE